MRCGTLISLLGEHEGHYQVRVLNALGGRCLVTVRPTPVKREVLRGIVETSSMQSRNPLFVTFWGGLNRSLLVVSRNSLAPTGGLGQCCRNNHEGVVKRKPQRR